MAIKRDIAAADTGIDDRRSGWRVDAAVAVAVAVMILLFHAVSGFNTLTNFHGDNDNLLRLVEVRDLIAGQGWFDLHQYRMGPEGGFVMHWSRIVDAPIAAIILAAAAITGDMPAAEMVALVAWPLLLFATALFFLLRAVRALGGDYAVLPAIVVGSASLYFLGIFAPGAIDHHNVQLVLTLAVVVALLHAEDNFAMGMLAGAGAALMLAVGMETAPYVAAGGAVAAIAFALDGERARKQAIGYGLALATAGGVAFVATVPADAWGRPACDAYSMVQFSLAALGGAGLALVASIRALRGSLIRRLLALCVLGLAVAVATIVFFPQCLQDPYAALDPRLKTYWLSAVGEAQPLWSMFAKTPALAVGYYATPFLGAVILALRIRRDGLRRDTAIVAVFLSFALLVSIWQVRGAMFSIPLAVIPLSAWVGEWRERAVGRVPAYATLGMVVAWLVSFNVTWAMAATSLSRAFGHDVQAVAGGTGECQVATDYAALAALPKGGVLAISNLGAPILRYTSHRVLSGPYHRNVEGNLLALSAFMDPQASARDVVARHGLAYVAYCPGNGETQTLAQWAPEGFIAALEKGDIPSWLEAVPGTEDASLRIFSVVPGERR